MSIDSRYKEEIDSFCGETYKVSSEEMLQMAKRNMINVTNTSSAKARITKRALLIPIAAALFGMTAVTAAAGAAGYGPLSDVFIKYFGDETTEKLAEEGYIYTADDYASDSSADTDRANGGYAVMGETITKDGFSAKILGIAGDTQSPQVLVDITVEDERIAEQSDMLGVYILTLGTEEFEKNRENYLEEYGKAVKDDTDPKLFHASVRCPPLWVTSGEEVVVDIVCIHTMEDNSDGIHKYYRDEEVCDHGFSPSDFHKSIDEVTDPDPTKITAANYYAKIKEYFPEMQFRFTVPENKFKEAAYMLYDDLDLGYTVNGYPYHLCRGEFGAHNTDITLDFGLGSGYPAEEFNENEHNWIAAKEVAKEFVLTVDGKEYTPVVEKTGLYCDTVGDCNLCIKDRCYLTLYFPAIDFNSAGSVVLTANDSFGGEKTSHDIKNISVQKETETAEESEPEGYSWLDYPASDTESAPADSAEEK